jgi:OmpA-OmpF porin, OOP family
MAYFMHSQSAAFLHGKNSIHSTPAQQTSLPSSSTMNPLMNPIVNPKPKFSVTLTRALFGAAMLAVLSGCSSMPGSSKSSDAGNPQAGRITDERIIAERAAIDGLQQRLSNLNKAGVPIKNYNFAKAQCWLDTAKTQYHENDRTGYIEQAMEQSVLIMNALDANKAAAPVTNTPLIAGSDRLREDLWTRLGALRGARGFECAAQTAACAEVRLVRAGHANEQTGWRQASPHIAMVEEQLRQAEREAAQCAQPSIVAAAPAPAPAPAARPAAPAPAPVAAPQAPGTERFVLLSDTLFKFDKSDMPNMLPGGRIRLQAVINQLKKYQRIDRIEVLGFTDRLGSDEYNAILSGARAATVRQFLQSNGVNAATFNASGRGKANTMSGVCSERASRSEQIACLQPDRRVEIEVYGVVSR